MAQKKSTGSTGAKKKTTGTGARKTTAKRINTPKTTKSAASTRSSAAKKTTASAAKRPAQKRAKAMTSKPFNNQFWSVILFALGVLTLLLTVIPGGKAWLWMHNALLGLFGLGIILVPLILGYTGILIGQDRSRTAAVRALAGVLLALIASSALQIFIGEPLPESEAAGLLWYQRLGAHISHLWEEGQALHGGGVLSGILVLPLTALLDTVGAKIVIVMLIIVLLLLLTNRSILEMLGLLAKPFIWIGKGIVSLATNGIEGFENEFPEEAEYEDELPEEEEYEEEEEPEEDEDEVQLTIPFFGRRRRTAVSRQEPDAEEEKPLRSAAKDKPQPKRAAAKHAEPAEEITFMLSHKPEPAADPASIDVDIPITGTVSSPAAKPAAPSPAASAPAAQPAASAPAQQPEMNAADAAAFNEIVSRAAKESDEQRAAARADAAKHDAAAQDERIYDEEPEIPYIAPPLSLLKRADNGGNDADKSAELREKGKLLVDTLQSFGVSVRITGIRRGPSVTRYEIQPAAGVKISKITTLADDIGLNLGGTSVRISQVEGKPALGVEVPNNTKDMVSLREILEQPEFRNSQSKLTFAVGRDIDGNVILGDIAKMPHMIIAGTTGSGKSVCTNSIIMSVLYHAAPDEVRLLLIDPKVVEFQPYDGVPHLLIPVVTDPQKAAGALNWAVIEMERRYGLCAQYGVRDIGGYNKLAEQNPEMKKLPQILIIIDEFADLMMTVGKEVESAVIRIAQKARAAGIHLIIATQRPQADVITGLIKSNIPSRIGMSVKSAIDSRIILDCTGAETLLGNGDLLFYPNGAREPKRVQGCFCSEKEVEAVVTFLKSNGVSEYDAAIMDAVEQNIPLTKGEKASGAEDDAGEISGEEALIVRAAELAVDMNQLSTTALQRRLKLGYAKAARIMDELEERGVIGPSEGAKPRRVLMTPQQLTEWKLRIASKGADVSDV